MTTLTRSHHFTVPASSEQVFPLLCPVREYDWIAPWRCEMLHSASGVAEEDCIFRTASPDGSSTIWVVSRYEPPARIEFTCFVADTYVLRLKIVLNAEGASTRLDWTRRWLSLGPRGDQWLAAWSEEDFQKMMDFLGRALTHYLTTGGMLRP
jgi:hypothetical protein